MNKVICVVGPTAVGKTKISIELAKKYNIDIISGDSVSVYEKIMKSKHISHVVNKLTPESYNQVPTKENTTIKVINKPTVVKTLEPYKLPIKSIIRRY